MPFERFISTSDISILEDSVSMISAAARLVGVVATAGRFSSIQGLIQGSIELHIITSSISI
jgi:hypothetical protein